MWKRHSDRNNVKSWMTALLFKIIGKIRRKISWMNDAGREARRKNQRNMTYKKNYGINKYQGKGEK